MLFSVPKYLLSATQVGLTFIEFLDTHWEGHKIKHNKKYNE